MRTLCLSLYYLVGCYLPSSTAPVVGKACRKIRAALCRHIFVDAGKNINVDSHAYFGKNRIALGDNSGIGQHFHLQGTALTVGRNVIMAPYVTVLGAGHRYEDKNCTIIEQGNRPKSELVIGDDVWLGRGSTILGGVRTIGQGAVIGACAVVTHDVPPYAVVAGNPARIIKYRT